MSSPPSLDITIPLARQKGMGFAYAIFVEEKHKLELKKGVSDKPREEELEKNLTEFYAMISEIDAGSYHLYLSLMNEHNPFSSSAFCNWRWS